MAIANSTDPWWKVLKEISHGGRIHGARRAVGDVFQAPLTAMTFLELEGIVQKTQDPSAAPAPDASKKGAPPAPDKSAA